MPHLRARLALVAAVSLSLAPFVHAQVKTEIGFLWHMHQPNYYPGENIIQTQNNNRYSFNVVDVHNQRFGPYTSWPKDAMVTGSGLPNLGASVSFSGTLMQNLNVLRDNNVNGGMWNNWTAPYNDARNLKTARNNPRLDLVGFGYSHALLPLMDQRDIRMQIKLHKQMTQNTFGSSVPYSKGFFPAECAFSERIIPALLAEGIQWTIYDNIHVDRATKNYPHTNSSNLYAPNKADQVNADPVASGGSWVQLNNLWAPSKVSAPNGYRPAYVQYVDPNTGNVQKIVGVPAARYEGNEDGRGGFGALQYQSVMDQYRQYNTDPARPMLVVLHHDGDNYGGGSDAYYHGNFQSMVNWANNNANYNVTGIQDYLDRFPVPQSAVVHVADGSWAGADNGDPEFKKWLADPNAQGWSPDRNSWAVLTAAKNRVYTAEDAQPITNLNNVINNTGNSTERAWGALIQAQSSDYWYWDGTEIWDSNATRGANLAVQHANNVLTPTVLANETTPPTVFVPQRDTYNPGEVEWGPQKESSNFNIWTYAYDVSGLQSVTLKFRTDKDGENPLTSTQNEVYAVGSEVDAWQSLAMTSSDMAPQNGVLTPLYRALKFTAPINGITNKLVDYYVEAVDGRGNITRSDIQHVWVGSNVTAPTGGFTMDGVLDQGTTVLATNGTMSINYKVEDGKLYVAAPDARNNNDHFIFLALQPGALRAAQWAKAGQVANWDAFLADEVSNNYSGWFDATGTNGSATGAAGGVLEGFIDLAGEFGGVYPEEIWVAFGAWANPDGGALVPSLQVPAGNGNGNIEAAEYVRLVMPQPEWAGSVTGDWSTKVGWTLTMSPNQPTMTAKFGTRGTGSATVTLDQAVTINRLELGGTSYTIQPGLTPYALTFAGTNAKSIDVVAGNHTISVPVVMNKNSQVSAVSGASVRLTSTLTATGRSITKTGGGTFEMNTVRAAALNVDAGTAKLSLALNGVSRLGAISVASTGATFDLGGGSLLIDGAAQFNAVKGLITGGKIVTSIPSSGASVGYARLSDLYTTLPSTYLGETITADTIVLRYTLKGDANLDRIVNFDDLLKLAASYNQTGSWSGGDFTSDGVVNFDDLLALAANYNANLSADWAMAMTLVPEPSAIVAALGMTAVLKRRRR